MDPQRRELLISQDDVADYVPEIPPFSYKGTRLRTLKVAFCQGTLIVIFIALSIAFKATHLTFGPTCSNMAVLLVYQVALWAISFLIYNYYEMEHANLKRIGYPTVSRVLRRITSYQFIFISWWNAFSQLYLVGSLLWASDALCDWDVSYSALNLTTYCVMVHGWVFFVTVLCYAKDVFKFNKSGRLLYLTDLDSIHHWRTHSRSSELGIDADDDHDVRTRIHKILLNRCEDYAYLIEFHENRSRDMCRWFASRSELDAPSRPFMPIRH